MKARVNGCKGLLMFMNDYEVFLIILYDPEITNQSFSTGRNWIRVKYLLLASWIRVEGS